MSTIGTVSAAIRAPQHPKDCDVCGGELVVHLHTLRWRDGVQVASHVARIFRCPLWSGADDLAGFVSALGVSGSAPTGPEGAA